MILLRHKSMISAALKYPFYKIEVEKNDEFWGSYSQSFTSGKLPFSLFNKKKMDGIMLPIASCRSQQETHLISCILQKCNHPFIIVIRVSRVKKKACKKKHVFKHYKWMPVFNNLTFIISLMLVICINL